MEFLSLPSGAVREWTQGPAGLEHGMRQSASPGMSGSFDPGPGEPRSTTTSMRLADMEGRGDCAFRPRPCASSAAFA